MAVNFLTEAGFKAFEDHYRDAKGYHARALQFLEEGQRPSVVFNVASLALESYLIALCHLYGLPPGNHSYGSLMDTVEMLIEVPGELNEAIRSMDFIFAICSLEHYYYKLPDQDDRDRVLFLCRRTEALFDQNRIAQLKGQFAEGIEITKQEE